MFEQQETGNDNLLGADKSFAMTFKIVLQYIVSDIQKKPRSFKIGLFTIYLVVSFLALIQSAFQLSPLIFLQLSESNVGDTDFIITPIPAQNDTNLLKNQQKFGPEEPTNLLLGNITNFGDLFQTIKFINTTEVEHTTRRMSGIFGQSPRWLLIGNLLNPNPNATRISNKVRSFVVIIDSTQELSIGLGRNLDINPIENRDIYVTGSSLRGLNLTVGDQILLNLDLIDFIIKSNPQFSKQDDPRLYLEDQINKIIKDAMDSFFKTIFGDNILDLQFNSTLVKDFVDIVYDNIGDFQTVEYKNEIHRYVQQQFDNNNNTDNKTQADIHQFIDDTFDSNLTDVVKQIKDVVDLIPTNITFSLAETITNISPFILDSLNLTISFRINTNIESSHGKWADSLGNVMAVDYRNITNIVIEELRKNLNRTVDLAAESEDEQVSTAARISRLLLLQPLLDFLNNRTTSSFNLSEYSMSSNMVITDRVNVYSDKDEIRDNVISQSNELYTKLGKSNPSQLMAPLGIAVQGFLIMKNFLDNMVVTATFLLFMLSVLLIYSLMIGDVEAKTYEFGMLRALGFNKAWLVVLLLIEALIFAIPGLCLGMVTAYLSNSIVCMIIFGSTRLVSEYQLHYSAVILGCLTGILIPLVSNVLPIMRALSKTLRDSLDLYHRTINEMVVQVIKLEKMGISMNQLFIAVLLVVMGFVCYYLAPQAFIFQDIKLFLAIINIILIIMIIGFTLVANLIQKPFETGLVHLMLLIYKKDTNLKPIVLKNMQGHDRRNSKTTLMYTLALSFLIFAGAGFALQTVVIEDLIQSTLGADITVFTPTGDQYGLNEFEIRTFLELQNQNDPSLIRAYSFVALPIESYPNSFKGSIYPLSNFPTSKTQVVGVEENLLHAIYQRYYSPVDYDEELSYPSLENGARDGVYALYTRQGNVDLPVNGDFFNVQSNSQARQSFKLGTKNVSTEIDREINIILPSGLEKSTSMNVDTPAMLDFSTVTFRMKIRHTAQKISGFVFSGYSSMAAAGNSLVSMDDYLYILNRFYGTDIQKKDFTDPIVKQFFDQLPKNLTYGVPKDTLFVAFARSTTYTERMDFANGLRNYFRDDTTQLFDVPTLVAQAAETFFYIQLFYIIVALVATTLAFFLILVSFISNVRENSWEFGVLRAIGLNKYQITRVYVYEALALILASGIIGTVVGIVVAIALTVQIVLFTELPFTFVFPTSMFLLTFIGGFVTAVGGSYFSVREIREKSISTILKGLI